MSATRQLTPPQAPAPTPVAPVVRYQPAPQAQWNTPDILKGAVVAVAVACVLLMLAVIVGARSHRSAMQSVGRDSALNIIAAEHIAAALADMDTNAVNELLTRQTNREAAQGFETRRKEAVNALITASKNITYGDAERLPIQRLALGMGTYQAQVQQARDLQTAGDKHFLDAFRASSQTMDAGLLPAAADLEKANVEALNQIYSLHRASSQRSTLLVTFAALLVGSILLWVQTFLARHMRRIFNPMLLAATAVTFMFGVYSTSSLQAEDREMQTAKQDAFESIHVMWQARALGYSANADESRYLLDTSNAEAHFRAFRSKAEQVANWPANFSLATIESQVQAHQKMTEFSGLLADELNNITFSGESEAALQTLSGFRVYLEIDRQIRKLEQNGQHQSAVALCLGNAEGQSNWAFARFDESLGRALAINQDAFDRAVKRGFDDVSGFEIVAPITSLAIALLALFGLLPRIREYSA